MNITGALLDCVEHVLVVWPTLKFVRGFPPPAVLLPRVIDHHVLSVLHKRTVAAAENMKTLQRKPHCKGGCHVPKVAPDKHPHCCPAH